VSVVIPAFNAGRYIRQAVDSVLQQTIDSVEIIVVDDGSTDDTRTVLSPYRDRIHYLSQSHAGVSTARNRGIQAARGEFVAFLDADDYFLLPSKLAEQSAYFTSQPELGIVHSGWRVIDENETVVVDKKPWTHAPSLDLKSWLRFQPALPSAMMFRRNALVSIGGFDSWLAHLEDMDLVLRLSLKGYATAWLEKITVAYRRHSGNASLKVSDQDEALAAILDKFFAQAGLPSEIQSLEREVRYSTLVWIACQYHRAGRFDEMARRLLQSLRYSLFSVGATLLDWVERFRGNYSEDFGIHLSVFDLTELDEWQQIVRLQLIGITPDEAFFPPSRKSLLTDWNLPVRQKLLSRAQPETVTSVLDFRPTETDAALYREAITSYPAKLNLSRALARDYGRHRSGWVFALQSLKELHHDHGVMVDAFPEHTFDRSGGKPQAAHQEPWIGFLHNPPGIPQWFIHNQSPQSLLANEAFQESLRSCLGFFCLSEYHKRWWENHLNLPLVRLFHPTEIPARKFSLENFLANPNKKIVQIGSWLRKLHSIYYLPVTRLKRAIVHQQVPYINELFTTEKKEFQLDPDYGSVQEVGFLSDAQYDALLSCNIVYLELYDSSANNTVIECIVRNTPILVNPLPAVKEYLGEEYPFYFTNRSQAARKAEDVVLIEETHKYLQAHPIKEKLTAAYFLKSVAKSEIYQSLVAE
jgi:glycosyltransferase involved in cell wall biosynthesis